jgi:hypothetical protein
MKLSRSSWSAAVAAGLVSAGLVLPLSLQLQGCSSDPSDADATGNANAGQAGSASGGAGTTGTAGTAGTTGLGSGGSSPVPTSTAPTPLPPVTVEGGDCTEGAFSIRKIATTSYSGKTYEVIAATPCEYVLSYARKGQTYAVAETATHYVVDSHFELPYLPGVMDEVVFIPGEKNLGWAIGLDVKELVGKIGALPFLYHVEPGYEYGYFTDYNDGLGDIFGAFRPTWRFVKNGGAVEMKTFVPPDPDWPRHRGGWNPKEINQEIGFGLYVDEGGKVYVPKGLPLGRKKWSDEPRCTMINLASAAVPITRTQFPGDESYYPAETLLPNYASIGSPGHKYWGHKGKPMREVAKWDDTLPGNFDKPFGGGCDLEGYSVAHAEGFTWPELRDKIRDKVRAGEIPAIPKENLYRVTVYEQDGQGPLVKKGSLWYEWHDDAWFPKSDGDSLISLDASRDTFRISGYLPETRRAFVVVEDL